jgi:hypothetical protein
MKDLKLSLIVAAIDRATAPLRKVTDGLKGLEERGERLKKTFQKISFGGILGGGLIIGGAIEAGRGLYELTNKTAELGEQFLHMAIKSGASVEQIQRLRFAAKQLGVDEDGLSQVFFRFQTHLANGVMGNKETVKALAQLGIGTKELKRLTKDPNEAFLRLVDGFTKLRNPTQRAKLAMDLFSRSGYQILPMLTAGRAEILRFMGQLDAAHAVMSTADAKASEEFIQNKNRMGLALQGLQMRIGIALLPVMSGLIEKLALVVRNLQPAVLTRFTLAMAKLIDQLPALIDLFSKLLDFVAWLVPKVMAVTERFGGLKNVLIAVAAIMAGEFLLNVIRLGSAIWGLVEAVGALKFAGLIGGALSAAGALLSLIPAITSAADVMAVFDLAMDANPIGLIVIAVAALAAGAYVLIRYWKPITAFFSNVCDQVASYFTNLWKHITDGMPAWLKTGLKIGAIGGAIAINPTLGVGLAASAAVGAVARPAPSRAAAAPASRADVHLHVTADGQVQVKKVAASGGATVNVNRGVFPH